MKHVRDGIQKYIDTSTKFGKSKLSVDVEHNRTPMLYKYLMDYHGYKHPLSNTPLGDLFKVDGPGYSKVKCRLNPT